MSVKEHIRGNSFFTHYKDGDLWYITEDTNFSFPVSISDLGTATVNRIEKSLIMMRYIRKWLEITAPASDMI
jgi:hypothetical protein